MYSKIIDVQSDEWKNFLQGVEHDIYHLPEFALINAQETNDTPIAYYGKEEELEMLIPLIRRKIVQRGSEINRDSEVNRRTEANSSDRFSIERELSKIQLTAKDHKNTPLENVLILCGLYDELLEIVHKKEGFALQDNLKDQINDQPELSRELFDAISPYNYGSPLIKYNGKLFQHGLAYSSVEISYIYKLIEKLFLKCFRTCKENHIVSLFLRIHPLFPFPLDKAALLGDVIKHGETVYVDLTKTSSEIYTDIRKAYRKKFNVLKLKGYHTEIDNFNDIEECIEIYNRAMGRLGASSFYFFSKNYYEELITKFKQNIHLCSVKDKNSSIASFCIYFAYQGIGQAHLAATDDRYIHDSPGKLCYLHITNWLKERKFKVFHLGGGRGGSYDTLFHFKLGFSKSTTFFHTWRVITDLRNYLRICYNSNPGVLDVFGEQSLKEMLEELKIDMLFNYDKMVFASYPDNPYEALERLNQYIFLKVNSPYFPSYRSSVLK
jgi:hypothetical protein